MVHDLWKFEPGGTYYNDLEPQVDAFGEPFYDPLDDIDFFAVGSPRRRDGTRSGGYGYPDPVRTARTQAEFARERGEEPPLTPERMASDVYFYEVERHKAGLGYIFPSFEERYGYPDPRPRFPEDERPLSGGV